MKCDKDMLKICSRLLVFCFTNHLILLYFWLIQFYCIFDQKLLHCFQNILLLVSVINREYVTGLALKRSKWFSTVWHALVVISKHTLISPICSLDFIQHMFIFFLHKYTLANEKNNASISCNDIQKKLWTIRTKHYHKYIPCLMRLQIL